MQELQTSRLDATVAERQILERIEQIRREWHARRSLQQPVPSCIVRAYHELIERQYELLDGLDQHPTRRSINVP